MVGKNISHYRILEKLGGGGRGVVYKAEDNKLGRMVALKVLPPERVADPSRKQRFVQEARAASALNHPNLIVIHDVKKVSARRLHEWRGSEGGLCHHPSGLRQAGLGPLRAAGLGIQRPTGVQAGSD